MVWVPVGGLPGPLCPQQHQLGSPVPHALGPPGLLPPDPAAPTGPGALPAPSGSFLGRDLHRHAQEGKRARGKEARRPPGIPARSLTPSRLPRGGRGCVFTSGRFFCEETQRQRLTGYQQETVVYSPGPRQN